MAFKNGDRVQWKDGNGKTRTGVYQSPGGTGLALVLPDDGGAVVGIPEGDLQPA